MEVSTRMSMLLLGGTFTTLDPTIDRHASYHVSLIDRALTPFVSLTPDWLVPVLLGLIALSPLRLLTRVLDIFIVS